MNVRILCGSYVLSSPFIEGGCASEWTDTLEEPGYPISCPNCRQTCQGEVSECARVMLLKRVVFVFGCSHRAFTFSRRNREPFFSPEVTAEESRETGEA